MSAPVFLADPALLATAAPGGAVRLDGPEGRHAVSVRRLAPGEPVELVDGHGRRVRGVVAGATAPDRLDVAVGEVVDEPAPALRLVVVQALPKGDRGERAVELLTEVGVDVIVPWAARRCVAVWRGPKAERGRQRWEATAVAAAKQARRARVPVIERIATTPSVAGLLRAADLGLVLHEQAAEPFAGLPATPPAAGERPRTVVVVVGPEGGLDPDELADLAAAGARPVRLGPTVLRTSTAGAVAVAVLAARAGLWS